MKRKLCTLLAIVFFIVLGGTAYAMPITYYFGGTLEGAFSTIPIGTQFDGFFSYDSEAPAEPSSTEICSGYKFIELFVTIGDYAVQFDVADDLIVVCNGIPTADSLELDGSNNVGEMDNLYHFTFDLALRNTSGTIFDDTNLPGTGLTLADFDCPRGDWFGFSEEGAIYTATSDLTYFSTVNPVPEPATMLLFSTGLVGLVGTRIRKKKK